MGFMMFRFICIIAVSALLMGCGEQKYPTGRDTYRAFGDGRFQIGRVIGDEKPLMDVKTGFVLLSNVYDYRRTRDALYFVGSFGEPVSYVVITLNDGSIHRFRRIDEVKESDWKEQLARLNPAKRL